MRYTLGIAIAIESDPGNSLRVGITAMSPKVTITWTTFCLAVMLTWTSSLAGTEALHTSSAKSPYCNNTACLYM